ncbi:MAG: hypothetical protein H6712_06405 [Myxococcales bacterium]|nr:hypothetical protein [Myxococcales bacterium]MCB9713466.1 hypothetical protein [Myxococcales bacterium]
MAGTLILWLVYAVFLKLAIGLATAVDPRTNSLGRAFVTAAVLSAGQGLLALVGGPLLLLWPLAWLLIIKSSYGIGWGRAILVWLALVVIAVILVITLLVPLGLMAGGVLLLTP